MLLGLALVTSACGGNKPKESANQPPQTNPQQELKAEVQVQTKIVVDDLNREMEIPLTPQRIVAGEFAAELLRLGIKPVASGDNGFKVIYTLDEMEGVEQIGDPPNPEKILELNPDLVVAPTIFQEIYPEQMEQITQIAPVFYLSFDQDPIYGIFTKLGKLVGQTEKAEAWIAGYEQEAELAREQLKSVIGDETVSIFRVEKGRLRIYLNRNFAGYMLRTSLQLPAPKAVAAEIEKNPNSSAVEISLEKLPEYAGDHLFVIVREEGDDRKAFEEIEKSGLWNSLEAVKNGKVHFLETNKYYGSDIVTIQETMKEAVELLTSAETVK
ncbi:ABC transporter substrate-binding protein [Paenibacillus sp. MMS20-IR301]|uniref:ABC transporter substrate-binding protein n=1 Tax=Paenibacillus sp. MMS20-IR301 TaxID=2895946 RepID=UPI0028EE614C|nr:ABC transporter substrate-binding protein [Paenibacillus sp. MMS20-IR301]WNS44362.1 ABC transporter substrate-binding protein [Paenibacillus sp. MMS20-IR301]